MLTITLCRTLILSLVFSFLHKFGFILVSIFFVLQILIVLPYCCKFGQNAFLGGIISLFGPAMVVHDFSYYYLIIGMFNSFGFMVIFVLLIYLIRCDNRPFPEVFYSNKTFPEFFKDIQFDNDNLSIYPFFDLLPNHKFFIFSMILFVLLIISTGFILCLHKYLDPIKRYRISLFISRIIGFIVLMALSIPLLVVCNIIAFGLIMSLPILCFFEKMDLKIHAQFIIIVDVLTKILPFLWSLRICNLILVWKPEEQIWIEKIKDEKQLDSESPEGEDVGLLGCKGRITS